MCLDKTGTLKISEDPEEMQQKGSKDKILKLYYFSVPAGCFVSALKTVLI